MFRGNPNDLGIIGSFSHSVARRFIDQTDCVLVFGASLNFWTTSFGTFVPAVPLIQVDSKRTNIGKYSNADVAVVGDARLVAEQLLDVLTDRSEEDKPFHSQEVRQSLAEFDPAGEFHAAHTARTIDPRSLGIALDRLLPEDRNLVYDAGNFLGIVPYISVPGPSYFKFTNNFASIGLGFGAGDTSERTWNAIGLIHFQPWKHVGFVGGYRALDVDYETGSGINQFKYDMLMHGPGLAVTFNW